MLQLTNSEAAESLGDWLEASLLTKADGDRISDADVLDILGEAGRERDESLEQITQQIRQRALALGDKYPVERSGQGFRVKGAWDAYLCYSFLLFVSLNQSYASMRFRAGSANRPARLFENVTAHALERFLNGSTIRMGAPREGAIPRAFPAAIDFLASAIREPVGARDLERQDSGDDGLDVWFWKSFADDRPGQIFLIAQCAIGDDWGQKRSELDIRLWKRHIDWFTEPMRVFAVPFQIPAASWRETATRGGLVLDRLRIAASVVHGALLPAVQTGMRTWTAARRTNAINTLSV
jgi:hypothetical protein